MKKSNQGIGLISMVGRVSVLVSIASAGAFAQEPIVIQSFDGGGLPSGLNEKSHLELADGESYRLEGKVVLVDGHAHFKVDLKDYPWLANSRRRIAPYYPLSGKPAKWTKYIGQMVDMTFKVHGFIRDNRGAPVYELVLEPMKEPKLLPYRDR